jgi:hypothetical protein
MSGIEQSKEFAKVIQSGMEQQSVGIVKADMSEFGSKKVTVMYHWFGIRTKLCRFIPQVYRDCGAPSRERGHSAIWHETGIVVLANNRVLAIMARRKGGAHAPYDLRTQVEHSFGNKPDSRQSAPSGAAC